MSAIEQAEIESEDPSVSVNVSREQAIQNAKENLNMLAAFCLQDDFLFMFPKMFLVIWELLKSRIHKTRDFSQIALGIPRGFAKTTFVKIFIVYVVLFTEKKFICIISHIEDHAQNIIKDACTFLSSQNIVALFGRWDVQVERDRADCKVIVFRGRRIILAGLGANGSIRGLNVGNSRPDLMIFEDFQRKEDSENEELSKKLYKDMYGTFMKAKSPFGCMFIFVANMYPTPGSILKKLKQNKDWVSFIVGAILDDGTSLWEELQPIEQLLEEYRKDLEANCPEVFLAEVLNDETAGIKAGIDITALPKWSFADTDLPQGRGIVIDPALDNPMSDYNGVGLVGIYDGKPVLEKAILDKFNPLQLIKTALILGLENNCRFITIENVGIQKSYLFWFNKICQDNGIIGFEFEPLSIGGGSKNGKIAAVLKKWVKKDCYVKDQVYPFIINEILRWNPIKAKNQDTCLDLLVMANNILAEYGDRLTMVYEHSGPGLYTTVTVRSVEENCEF